MTTLTDRCDEAMANAVLADLLDRRGIRQTMEEIKMGDPEVWKDIREAIGSAARLALMAELDAAGWQVVPKVATEGMKEVGAEDENEWRRMPMPPPTREEVARIINHCLYDPGINGKPSADIFEYRVADAVLRLLVGINPQMLSDRSANPSRC